ncbi:MAG: hypothetical protein AB1489_34055 [Acidobacteriota bacterium]
MKLNTLISFFRASIAIAIASNEDRIDLAKAAAEIGETDPHRIALAALALIAEMDDSTKFQAFDGTTLWIRRPIKPPHIGINNEKINDLTE